MTANRDLKRRVRDRQAQTGESYVTALQHVLAQRPSGIPTVELVEFVDVTEVAATLGLKCRATMSPTLAHTIDVEQTLGRFREMLDATRRDPALSLMRTIALQGEHVRISLSAVGFQDFQKAVRFIERVRAGLGGVSENGRMLALHAVPRSASSGDPPAIEGSPPAAPGEWIALFEPRLVPSFVAAVGPPLLVITSLGETVVPVLDRLQEEVP